MTTVTISNGGWQEMLLLYVVGSCSSCVLCHQPGSPLTPDMTDLGLCYYIHGKRTALSVCVSSNETILFLKRKIYDGAPRTIIGCDAPDLILTKVRHIVIVWTLL